MIKIKSLVIFLLLSSITLNFAENYDWLKFNPKVKVDVSANDNINGEIVSYLSRELRSLGDVIVVDEKPDWTISIVALELTNKGGNNTGVALSILILSKPHSPLIEMGINDLYRLKKINKFEMDSLQQMINIDFGLVTEYEGHWLRTGSPDNLRDICNGIVADFDSKYLEPTREYFQKLKNTNK